ncbi:hypothetical protein [Ferrimonas sp.]|uniref:hypothetical protein n=1 Tax=Ferrimonas sp. TaxID=2080861 RepID=UPI003A8CDE6B
MSFKSSKSLCSRLIFVALIMNLVSYSNPAFSFPDWYLSPPSQDERFWFGVGVGDSVSESRVNALADVSKQFYTRVKSKSETLLEKSGGEGNSSYKEKSVAVTDEFHFGNLEVINQETVEGKSYLLIRVDKAEFLALNAKAVRGSIDTFEDKIARAKILTGLGRISALAEAKEQQERIRILLPSLVLMSASLKASEAKFSAMSKEFSLLIASTSITVKSMQHFKPLSDALQNEWKDEGFSYSPKAANQLICVVSAKQSQGRDSKSHVAALRVQVQFLSDDGTQVGSYQKSYLEKSKTSLEEAKKKAWTLATESIGKDSFRHLMKINSKT